MRKQVAFSKIGVCVEHTLGQNLGQNLTSESGENTERSARIAGMALPARVDTGAERAGHACPEGR